MSLKSDSSLFPMIIFLIMVVFVPNAAVSSPIPGGRVALSPDELKNETVVAIGNFSVTEHNIEKNTSLVFQNLVNGYKQVVSGIKYTLLVNATCLEGYSANYAAVVLVQAWKKNPKLLLYFGKK